MYEYSVRVRACRVRHACVHVSECECECLRECEYLCECECECVCVCVCVRARAGVQAHAGGHEHSPNSTHHIGIPAPCKFTQPEVGGGERSRCDMCGKTLSALPSRACLRVQPCDNFVKCGLCHETKEFSGANDPPSVHCAPRGCTRAACLLHAI